VFVKSFAEDQLELHSIATPQENNVAMGGSRV
jgi:hypothetical protein